MATFTRRGNRWQARVKRKGYPPQYKTFTRKLDAERWAHDIEESIHTGDFTPKADKTTIADLCTWYQATVTPTRVQGTTEPYRLRTLSRALGAYTMASLTPDVIVSYVRTRKQAGLAAATIRRELQQLSDIISSAQALGQAATVVNPATTAKTIIRKLRLLPPSNRRTRRLLPGEFQVLMDTQLRACRWIQPMVRFALETAMRRGEIARMRRDDITGKTLHIRRSKTDWKTGEQGRVIPLSPAALAVLRDLPECPDNRVWPITDEHSITRAFERLIKAANQQGAAIQDLRFHDLRHEATSRLFEAGFAIEEVALFTGHKDWASLKRYTHPDPARIANRMT